MDRQPNASSGGRLSPERGGGPPSRPQTIAGNPPPPITASIPRRSPPSTTPGSIPRRTLPPVPFPPQQLHGGLPPGTGGGHPPPMSHARPPPMAHAQQSYPHGYANAALPPPRPGYYPTPPPQQQQRVATSAAAASTPYSRVPATTAAAIPRRSLSGTSPPREQQQRPPKREKSYSHVYIKSETPSFVVKIKLKDVPMDQGGIPRLRSSGRRPKRKRPRYQEMDLTDSDDFASEDDDDDMDSGGKRRLVKKSSKGRSKSPAVSEGRMSVSSGGGLSDLDGTPIMDSTIDAPPPGTLPTLWYSREIFSHIFVIDKILGWKTRPVVQLEFLPDAENPVTVLDPVEAANLSFKILWSHADIWTDSQKRMEVSRIDGAHCPVVLPIAAAKEEAAAQKRQNKTPRYKLAPKKEKEEREEVLLIKWRGRSYFHCSWERRKDLEKLDPSNNTARHKIRRYLQSQEVALGKNWKQLLDEQRASVPDLHPHKPDENAAATVPEKVVVVDSPAAAPVEEEGLFSPEYLEVERILACDESELDMNVLSRQRALNLRAEQEAVRRREAEEALEAELMERKSNSDGVLQKGAENVSATNGIPKPTPTALVNEEEEEHMDPEDNVRYVVKWKGLQYSEMTWEYWHDIKSDAVDQAEDFWHRQRAPDLQEVTAISNRPHPHVRDFRKLTESPAFGMSQRVRPVADLGDGFQLDEDEKETDPGFRLRGYQLEGVNWLLWNWWNRRSCILADEMGLGKTIQTLGFLHQLHTLSAAQVRGPFLIVAPLSLIAQWQSESQSWAPDLNVLFYHGSADARDFLVKQEFYYTNQFVPKATATKLKKQHVTKFHILITTYEVVLKDVAVLSKIRWKALVVDEAHRLKNAKARLFEELASVPREFCLLLTGTPLQNSTEELWALLHFSDPVAFACRDAFVEKFGQLTDSKQVSELHSVLKPYLLRRVKEDVEKSLPPKEETILEVTLTPIQKTYYKAIYERNTAFLYKGAKPSNSPSLMNVMMELRKCCNHPFLVRGAEERILLDAAANLKGKKDENGKEVVIDYLKLFGEHLVKSSGKIVLLEKLLPKLKSGGHKVLIFSQMVRVLDLLEELLKMKRYRYERLDGSTSASSRTAAVDRFHRKSCQRFVMLLSTRAGGLGLNLTAADTVIIFDSDWNPQNDLQAMARAHRIGQTRAVRVYRILTAKTYEMHMFHSASMKLGLDRAVLAHQRQQDGEESKSKAKSDRQVQAKEIDELLKKGAYDVFRDDDDKEAQQFMEADIDQFLERSSRKVTYGNTANTSISSGLGSFSKASFVADTGDGGKDVDLDDPDFWKKAVGLDAPEETPEEVAAMLDDGVKRSRKQVQVFDPYAAFAEAEQKKKDKIALKVKEEKQAKERLRLEKKQKKLEEKERKRRERDEARGRLFGQSSLLEMQHEDGDDIIIRDARSGKSKKMKKSERRRALKRAENEDPILERLKQAWEAPQRNRATSAALRFGFTRFCKIRHESNLTSLPIQDLELFVRSYIFQLSLQTAVSLLPLLRSRLGANTDLENGALRALVHTWLGLSNGEESNWICESISTAIKLQMDVKSHQRFLRLPFTLAEPLFVTNLRSGSAFRALRRIGILGRLNCVIEDALDSVLLGLGQEELGKRGCQTTDLTTLDVDLKARHVTTAELSLALGVRLRSNQTEHRAPAEWWDRSCDIALLIGTFVHGFGNYEAMRQDEDLSFADRIRRHAKHDDGCSRAYLCFDAAATAARKVFGDALDSAKSKAQEEAHAAVAAAVAASKLAEQGGLNASTTSNGGVQSPAPPSDASPESTLEAVKAADSVRSNAAVGLGKLNDDDSHLVTLPRLSQSMVAAVRAESVEIRDSNQKASSAPAKSEEQDGKKQNRSDANVEEDRLPPHQRLPMPDARILDGLLLQLVDNIVKNPTSKHQHKESSNPAHWEAPADVAVHEEVRSKALCKVLAMPPEAVEEERKPYVGIGFNGSQCGSSHRSLDDGSDFGIGAASSELVHVASGNDAPRYLRAIGVPMNISRYCVSALVYADTSTLNTVLSNEKRRNTIKEETQGETPVPSDGEKDEPKVTETPSVAGSNTDVTTVGSKTVVDSGEGMPLLFSESPKLRAGVCAAALHYGLPPMNNMSVDRGIWTSLQEHTSKPAGQTGATLSAEALFSMDGYLSAAGSFANGAQLPEHKALCQYMESTFLPHCLRLCVQGNGPTTRNARGSKGEYETAFGISLNPEHTGQRQTPLPDPSLPLSAHSTEAVACASAILRRVRLMRTAQYVVGGGISPETLLMFLQGPTMGKSMHGLPLWWCPWIHDLALLVHAATRGLFTILSDRQDAEKVKGTVFELEAIEQHIRNTFMSGGALPKAALDSSRPDEVNAWIKSQATQFPSANVIERRLALLCAEVTANLDGDGYRYDNLPMFDHGGWPCN